MAADPVFLDTNVLVAASVAEHPSHPAATALLAKLTAEQTPFCISHQVCREFLVVLTRKPVSGREFTVEEALQTLDAWRSACVVLDESPAVLLEDYPGLAKTLIASSFATALGLDFKRIQFTPDLLPGDVTGGYAYDPGEGRFVLRRGPIFTHLLLADEINRASPKTQSALLEAMQEQHVTLEGQPLPLPSPFIVIATQNPIEYEGTFPLPEAQLDRFVVKLSVGYPSAEEEGEILRRRAERRADELPLRPVLGAGAARARGRAPPARARRRRRLDAADVAAARRGGRARLRVPGRARPLRLVGGGRGGVRPAGPRRGAPGAHRAGRAPRPPRARAPPPAAAPAAAHPALAGLRPGARGRERHRVLRRARVPGRRLPPPARRAPRRALAGRWGAPGSGCPSSRCWRSGCWRSSPSSARCAAGGDPPTAPRPPCPGPGGG